MAFFNPGRLRYEMRPTNLFLIELFAHTPIPDWQGKKLRIPLEDDAVVISRGVECCRRRFSESDSYDSRGDAVRGLCPALVSTRPDIRGSF